MTQDLKVALLADPRPAAQEARATLVARHGDCAPQAADVIVAIGGDGFMLEVLHDHLHLGKPFYGLNRGTIGFLMNRFALDDLAERVAAANATLLYPLKMTVTQADGATSSALAINEVSLLRQTRQAAKLQVTVDGKLRLAELICDGILLSTPAGSTAYNLSAHGPILPLGSDVMALTPLSPFRPRRWRGAILRNSACVSIRVLEPEKRPVSATADAHEVRSILQVDIEEDRQHGLTLLFDPEHDLESRISNEQFAF